MHPGIDSCFLTWSLCKHCKGWSFSSKSGSGNDPDNHDNGSDEHNHDDDDDDDRDGNDKNRHHCGVGSCEPSLGRVRNTPDTRDAFLPVSLYYYSDDDDDFYEDDNDDDDDGKKEGSPASFIGFGLISPNWAKPTKLLLPNVDDDDFDDDDDDND